MEYMRKILLLVFVLVSFSAIGQVVQFPTNYGVGYRRIGADTLLWIPTDTFSVPAPLASRTHVARKGANLYYWTGTRWEGLSGGVTDTTSLSNRINLKLNISDTASMLTNYRHWLQGYLKGSDTINKWITSVYRKTASDSVFYTKGSSHTFAFKDSTGSGSNIADSASYLYNIGLAVRKDSILRMGVVDLFLEADYGVKDSTGASAAFNREVGEWVDQSDSLRNATQTLTAYRPTYVISSYNNRPAIRASGSYMQNTAWGGMKNKKGQVTIYAYKLNSTNNGNLLSGISGVDWALYSANGTALYLGNYSNSLATFSGYYSLGNLVMAVWDSGGRSNPERYLLYKNNRKKTFDSFSGTVPTSSSGIVNQGYKIMGGGSEFISADVFAVIHLKQTPTNDQLNTIRRYLEEKYFAKPKEKSLIVCEGDSRTEGYPGQLYPTNHQLAYPSLLADKLNANSYSPGGYLTRTYDSSRTSTVYNVGQRAERIASMVSQGFSQVDQKKDDWYRSNIVVFAGGVNDLFLDSTASATQTNFRSYCLTRKANSFKVVAVTIPDATVAGGGGTVTQSMFNLRRDSVNTWMRLNWHTFADALADWDSVAPYRGNMTYYNADSVHFTDSGNLVLAAEVYRAIQTITNADYMGDKTNENPPSYPKYDYTGQSSITTVGTVTAGKWNATPIETTYGGVPSGGATGKVLQKVSGSDYDVTWATVSGGSGVSDSTNFTLQRDTIALASFGAGGANASDTSAFTTSTIYGSFYNDGSDTLIITSIRGVVQGSSASITPTVYYNDSLNVTAGATKLVNSPSALTNTTTGVSSTPDNSKIPPGVWVWVSTGTVTTKPTYFSLTLIGYKKRR